MIRKATSYVLLLLLGLYLPAASMTVCVCMKSALDEKQSCGAGVPACCENHEADATPCCEDPDCCIVVPGLPDGMEPQLIHAPNPVSLPAPLFLADEFVALPARGLSLATLSYRAPPPPPGAPIRIALGVWRL
jgi:hypothetical protein